MAGCRVRQEQIAEIQLRRRVHHPREWLMFSVLPAHRFADTAVGPDHPEWRQPIGSGPFAVAHEHSPGAPLELRASPHADPQPGLEALRIAPSPGPDEALQDLLEGRAHGIIDVPPALRGAVSASDDLALKSYDLRTWWYIALDTAHPRLASRALREALDQAIDRDALRAQTVGVEPNDPNPPCEFVSGPFLQSSPYYNRSVALQPHAAASTILDHAGVTLRLGYPDDLPEAIGALPRRLQDQLAARGITLTLHPFPPDTWAQLRSDGELQGRIELALDRWVALPPEDVSPLLHTPDRSTGAGARNPFGWSDPRTDALLAAWDAATTDTGAQDAYHALHAHLAAERPLLFLWKLDTKSAWRSEIRNNTITPLWYFTEVEAWRR